MATVKGGAALEAALAKIARNVKDGGLLKVGFLAGAKYPDGTSVATVAAAQNWGTDKIPPRPFFSNMVAEKSSQWPDKIGKVLRAADYDAKKTLELMGVAIVGELQESIQQTNEPPLKPATIKRKGFAKPLVETSHMLNSADKEVDMN